MRTLARAGQQRQGAARREGEEGEGDGRRERRPTAEVHFFTSCRRICGPIEKRAGREQRRERVSYCVSPCVSARFSYSLTRVWFVCRSRPSSRSRSPFGGSRSANIYCPVCREMREQLQNGGAHHHPNSLSGSGRPQSTSRSPVRATIHHRRTEKTTGSPDSGFADPADKDLQLLRLREQLSKEQMTNRLLTHERDSLKQLHDQVGTIFLASLRVVLISCLKVMPGSLPFRSIMSLCAL